MNVTKSQVRLYANAKAVVTQFLFLPGENRIKNIINRLSKMPEEEVISALEKVMGDFKTRHRHLSRTLLHHYTRIHNGFTGLIDHYSQERKLLLGAFFTKEYSIQAAALFNPSIVAHPDQSGLNPGELRFVMSLRSTGEGHISSIVFQTGIIDAMANIHLDPPPAYYTGIEKKEKTIYEKGFIKNRLAQFPGIKMEWIDLLPDSFTAAQAQRILANKSVEESFMHALLEVLDMNYELEDTSNLTLNEQVITPNSKAESMGMEDARFVHFSDGDHSCYYGSYTAYNGKDIKTQFIETHDFNHFKIRSLYGAAISDKGMALFPEKVNGKYVMIARQGGEKITIMYSDDLYCWETFEVLAEPTYSWEMVQSGNCGSPVKTSKGWLLLTHGVGAMRTYVISAILLDLDNPSKIIGRIDKPFLEADETEREGYVPNVVYTCGLLLHNDHLIIPYAVSDAATGFATILLDDLLNEMK